jgi:hypothetical protein
VDLGGIGLNFVDSTGVAVFWDGTKVTNTLQKLRLLKNSSFI